MKLTPYYITYLFQEHTQSVTKVSIDVFGIKEREYADGRTLVGGPAEPHDGRMVL